MEIYRRQFLFTLTGIFCTPAIFKYSNIMPIKPLPIIIVGKTARLDYTDIIADLNVYTTSPDAAKEVSNLLRNFGFPNMAALEQIPGIDKITFLPQQVQSPPPWKPAFKQTDWVPPV